MNQRGSSIFIVIAVVFVIAIAGAGFYLLKDSSSTEPPLSTSPTEMKVNSPDEAQDVLYISYSKDGYENIKNQKHVLFFYANWCPTCRPADAEFQSRMSEIPDDIILVRVNYNDDDTDVDEEALADEYGITYQHTYVLVENGQVVKRWNGGGLSELLTQVN